MTTNADLIAYDDDGDIVICDPKNPNAWIRSDTTVSVTDRDRDLELADQ